MVMLSLKVEVPARSVVLDVIFVEAKPAFEAVLAEIKARVWRGEGEVRRARRRRENLVR